MSVYRKAYTDRQGRPARTDIFTVEFRDHTGQSRTMSTGLNQVSAAEAFEKKLKSYIDNRREGVPQPDHLKRWVGSLPIKQADRLGELGIIPRSARLSSLSMTELLKQWNAHVQSTTTSRTHAQNSHARARAIMDHIGAVFFSDVQPHAVINACAELGRTSQTKRHYWRAAFQSCRFIAEHLLGLGAHSSPLEGQKPRFAASADDDDHDHPRRAFTPEELAKVFEAAEGGPVVAKLSGPFRALVYRFAAATGLRRGELSTLTAGSFQLDSLPYSVRVSKKRAKSRRERQVPITADLAVRIRRHIDDAMLAPGARVFPLPHDTAGMLRKDLQAAKVPYKHPDTGLFADFHSFRHTFLTIGCQCADLRTMQELAGHASLNTTARYLHTNSAAQQQAAEALRRRMVS